MSDSLKQLDEAIARSDARRKLNAERESEAMMEGKELEQALEHDQARKDTEAKSAAPPSQQQVPLDQMLIQLEVQQAVFARQICTQLLSTAGRLAAEADSAVNAATKGVAENHKIATQRIKLAGEILLCVKDADVLATGALNRLAQAGKMIESKNEEARLTVVKQPA